VIRVLPRRFPARQDGPMWHNLMHLDLSVCEKVVRTVGVYLLLAAL